MQLCFLKLLVAVAMMSLRLLMMLLPRVTLSQRHKHLAKAVNRSIPVLSLLPRGMLLWYRKALSAKATRQPLRVNPPAGMLLQPLPVVAVRLERAPLCFAGQYRLTSYRTDQWTDTIIARRPLMSGGLSLPTASKTRALMYATNLPTLDVHKRRALFAQPL